MSLKVLHIVAGDLNGGAARGALWLHQGLLNEGVDSTILSNKRLEDEKKGVISLPTSFVSELFQTIKQKLDKLFLFSYLLRFDRLPFSPGIVGTDITKTKEYLEADIIHLHWVNGGFLSINSIAKINKPVIWTLRDMWPFTGGCHYSLECDNYQSSCGSCQLLSSENRNDLSNTLFKRKKLNFSNINKFVSISPWLESEAKKSSIIDADKVQTIMNCVDERLFYPEDRSKSLNELNIEDSTKMTILVGAQDFSDSYKGMDLFFDALTLLENEKFRVVTFGRIPSESVLAKYQSFEFIHLGHIRDDSKLRKIYSIADCFVCPSKYEAFGKTIVESMLCDVFPVVFDCTGPKDIVEHKKTGYKSICFNVNDLAQGILWACEQASSNFELRNAALKQFSIHTCAKSYIELYKRTLN